MCPTKALALVWHHHRIRLCDLLATDEKEFGRKFLKTTLFSVFCSTTNISFTSKQTVSLKTETRSLRFCWIYLVSCQDLECCVNEALSLGVWDLRVKFSFEKL